MGSHNSDRERYEALVGGHCAPGEMTVGELADRFTAYLREHTTARPGSSSATNARDAFRPLRAMYAGLPVRSFGVVQVKACRAMMLDAGLAVRTVNDRLARIRRAFRWGVGEGFVDPRTLETLRSVESLRSGSAGRVRPAPMRDVVRVLGLVGPAVAAMIRLQWLTAMRPGEVCGMTGREVDTDSEPWVYRPSQHKNAWRGKRRQVVLCSRAASIVAVRMGPGPIFGYRPASYYRAVARACERGGVPHWHPSQLRHAALTRIRRDHGADVARAVAGHSSATTTDTYTTEADLALAMRAMGSG